MKAGREFVTHRERHWWILMEESTTKWDGVSWAQWSWHHHYRCPPEPFSLSTSLLRVFLPLTLHLINSFAIITLKRTAYQPVPSLPNIHTTQTPTSTLLPTAILLPLPLRPVRPSYTSPSPSLRSSLAFSSPHHHTAPVRLRVGPESNLLLGAGAQ